MNKLFKILFLLLVVSNTAQAKWVNDTKSCKVWINDGYDNFVSWSGACKNSFASGEGTIIYSSKGPQDRKSCTATLVKGKIKGNATCIRNNGDTISGKIEDNHFVGEIIYIWKETGCDPYCFKQYNGTLYKDNLAVGTITLTDGKKRYTKFHPDQNGCLIWNQAPQADEKIFWSGGCKNGYGYGKGILKYESSTTKQVIQCSLKGGNIEGHAILNASYTPNCDTCYIHQEGVFKFGHLIKGVSTLGNGKKEEVDEEGLNDAMMDQLGTQYLHWYLNNVYK